MPDVTSVRSPHVIVPGPSSTLLFPPPAWAPLRSEGPGDGLPCLAGSYGSLGEAEHVGAFRVFGAAVALVGRECAVGVNLSFEPAQKRLAGWAGARAAVVGAAPGDLGGYLPVDVFACYARHLPRQLRFVLVSALVSGRVYARLRADARARREMRQTVRRSQTVVPCRRRMVMADRLHDLPSPLR